MCGKIALQLSLPKKQTKTDQAGRRSRALEPVLGLTHGGYTDASRVDALGGYIERLHDFSRSFTVQYMDMVMGT